MVFRYFCAINRKNDMETKGMFGKLKEELAGMVDAETLEKLKNAGTREEALGILEDISGELPDEARLNDLFAFADVRGAFGHFFISGMRSLIRIHEYTPS